MLESIDLNFINRLLWENYLGMHAYLRILVTASSATATALLYLLHPCSRALPAYIMPL